MVPMIRKKITLPVVFLFVITALNSAASAKTSPFARAVSVSFVEGTVIARMPGGSKWVPVALTMPIRAGTSVATGRRSLAEVQFEDGSAVRIGELSRVDFAEMDFGPHSGYVNHLNLVVGITTLSVVSRQSGEYVLTASGVNLATRGKTESRTDFRRGHLRVEVFKGHIQASDSTESAELKNNQVLACDCGARGAFYVSEKIQMDEWDKWVQTRDRQAALAAYRGPGPGMYEWENNITPFGGMGLIPGVFGSDGF